MFHETWNFQEFHEQELYMLGIHRSYISKIILYLELLRYQ
jgi:hypothetical protein